VTIPCAELPPAPTYGKGLLFPWFLSIRVKAFTADVGNGSVLYDVIVRIFFQLLTDLVDFLFINCISRILFSRIIIYI
jgi:hypothetical protein